ncbi:hypothetical protein [Cellulomonas xiejunii]|nr:hypothetical protein [Cellulomonas xiejunii]
MPRYLLIVDFRSGPDPRRVVDGAIADAATMRDWLGTADGR